MRKTEPGDWEPVMQAATTRCVILDTLLHLTGAQFLREVIDLDVLQVPLFFDDDLFLSMFQQGAAGR